MFVGEPRQFKVLRESNIPVVAAGTGNRIFSQIAKHAGLVVRGQLRNRYLSDGRRIKPRARLTELRVIDNPLFYMKIAEAVAPVCFTASANPFSSRRPWR